MKQFILQNMRAKIQSIENQGYTPQEIDKIGNTLVFLSKEIQNFTKTQALKYLYLLDEFSIKKFGISFLGLKYEVWQYGPVAQDIFIELSEEKPKIFGDFIETKRESHHQYTYTLVRPKKDFSDNEFSDNDLETLNFLIDRYKDKNATELVDLTHSENSLWYNIASEKGLLKAFENNTLRSSNYLIDFSVMLDKLKKDFYMSFLENQALNRHYNV